MLLVCLILYELICSLHSLVAKINHTQSRHSLSYSVAALISSLYTFIQALKLLYLYTASSGVDQSQGCSVFLSSLQVFFNPILLVIFLMLSSCFFASSLALILLSCPQWLDISPVPCYPACLPHVFGTPISSSVIFPTAMLKNIGESSSPYMTSVIKDVCNNTQSK